MKLAFYSKKDPNRPMGIKSKFSASVKIRRNMLKIKTYYPFITYKYSLKTYGGTNLSGFSQNKQAHLVYVVKSVLSNLSQLSLKDQKRFLKALPFEFLKYKDVYELFKKQPAYTAANVSLLKQGYQIKENKIVLTLTSPLFTINITGAYYLTSPKVKKTTLQPYLTHKNSGSSVNFLYNKEGEDTSVKSEKILSTLKAIPSSYNYSYKASTKKETAYVAQGPDGRLTLYLPKGKEEDPPFFRLQFDDKNNKRTTTIFGKKPLQEILFAAKTTLNENSCDPFTFGSDPTPPLFEVTKPKTTESKTTDPAESAKELGK